MNGVLFIELLTRKLAVAEKDSRSPLKGRRRSVNRRGFGNRTATAEDTAAAVSSSSSLTENE